MSFELTLAPVCHCHFHRHALPRWQVRCSSNVFACTSQSICCRKTRVPGTEAPQKREGAGHRPCDGRIERASFSRLLLRLVGHAPKRPERRRSRGAAGQTGTFPEVPCAASGSPAGWPTARRLYTRRIPSTKARTIVSSAPHGDEKSSHPRRLEKTIGAGCERVARDVRKCRSLPQAAGPTLLCEAQISGPRKAKMVICRVILLDKDNYEAEIPKSALGQQLFDKVKDRLSLEEADFFGLSYQTPSGLRHWLNLAKRVDKQLDNNPWVFSFEVKFYPPEPNILFADETRYLLVLQLRQDLLTGRLPCSFHTHALLGSYTIQSELGDYNAVEHGAGSGIDYLKPYIFAPNQSDELLYRIADLHRLHKGLLPEEADLLFLDSAKKLALYGVDLYKVKDGNGREVLVGVSAAGLYIYEDRLRMDTFKWPRIVKLSYKRNLFNVKVRSLEFDKVEQVHGFKCTTPKYAKRLWRITVETHQFFRLKQPELTDTRTLGFGSRRWRMSGRTLHEVSRPGSALGTLSKSVGSASRSTSRDTLTPRRATSITQLPADVLARRKLIASSQIYVNDAGQSERTAESGEQAELPSPTTLAGRSTSVRMLNGGSLGTRSPTVGTGVANRSRCEPEVDDFEDAVEYCPASGELKDGPSAALKNGEVKSPRTPTASATEDGGAGASGAMPAEGEIAAKTATKLEAAAKTAAAPVPAPQPRLRTSLMGGGVRSGSTAGSASDASSGAPSPTGADSAVPATGPSDTEQAEDVLLVPAFSPESIGATVDGLLDHVVPDTSERGEKLIRIGLPPTVRTTSVRYNPNVESEVRTTRQVPVVRTLSRNQVSNGYFDDEQFDSELISSMSHSSQLQTTETTTYTTEKDGYVEKRMTTKITIVSESAEDIDYDKALLDAIQRVTNMDPNLAVEKIEIKTEDSP